ncbi:MAG: four helix bundle protein [Candidatus Margulisbacteria bacterium]|nr:four helix bundle protein [Candidatus Margulisiibacteriota bacterium]
MGEGFRNLIVWQKAYGFALEVYKATKHFPKDELYGMTSQIRRAVVSISANIAEGYERQYRKEYVRFLVIAKGSLGEAETHLMFARDLEYLKKDQYEYLENIRQETGRLLKGLIRSL